MELEFLTVLLFCYKAVGFILVLGVGISAIFAPLFIMGMTGNPLWLLLYIISPLVMTICYKLLWLL